MTTARKRPKYVPGLLGGVRVTLLRELPIRQFAHFPDFLGELDGTMILYHCLSTVSVIAIRRGLATSGSVLHDAPDSWLELATDADVRAAYPAVAPELQLLRDAVRAGQAGGRTDGQPA